MTIADSSSRNFEIPLRSLARPKKIQFRGDLSPTLEDNYTEYSFSDGNEFLLNNSSKDSVFSLLSMPCLQEDSEKLTADSNSNGIPMDFDLEELENVQICTITDIVVICQVHLQNDPKPLGYIST